MHFRLKHHFSFHWAHFYGLCWLGLFTGGKSNSFSLYDCFLTEMNVGCNSVSELVRIVRTTVKKKNFQSVHSKHPLSASELSRSHNRTLCVPGFSRFNFCLYSGTKWVTLWSERPRGGLHNDWNASRILLKERSIVWLSHYRHVTFWWRFGRRPVMSQTLKSPNTNTAWSPDLFIALL